jgi:16S rRNA (guanine966-N2)-methyltransferase
MSATGRVRIIGGRWRRRQLPVPRAPGLRPSPDRVRETLFNWVAADLPGARCLDLFAGSGVLGFEAASRGASRVLLVERNPEVAAHLRRQAAALGAEEVDVLCADAFQWARAAGEAFDLVFVDPPYGTTGVCALLADLEHGGVLAKHARVYVEGSADATELELPVTWSALRQQRAGRVRYYLAAPTADESS